MNFDSALFLFVAGLIVGGAVVFLLYTRIAVAAAGLKAKVDAFENAFGTLKADVSGAGSAVSTALKATAAAATAVTAVPNAAPAGTVSTVGLAAPAAPVVAAPVAPVAPVAPAAPAA